MSAQLQPPTLTVKPSWAHWESALCHAGHGDARAAFGLDPERPVVMSGHQPIVFHPGILSKLIALDEAARRTNAQPVWIVPDQDSVDPGTIRVPVGQRASLRVELLELFAPGVLAHGVSACSLPAQPINKIEHPMLEPLVLRLDQYAQSQTLAQQFGYAVIEHACELLKINPPTLIFASQLFGFDAFGSILETMRRDPALCAQSYNRALAEHPQAGVRALMIGDDRTEFPLWGCRVGEARVGIDTQNIGLFSADELLPRGLLMSALVRLKLADLFIHGAGGWVYDRISERWFADWLGAELSPMAMVSATQRLDLGFSEDETADLASAQWRCHHSRHTPAMVGDAQAQQEKDQIVEQIARLARKDPQRLVLYRRLETLLKDYRARHGEQIEEYAQRVVVARKLEKQLRVARDRTWSFAIFGQEAIDSLDRATREAMG